MSRILTTFALASALATSTVFAQEVDNTGGAETIDSSPATPSAATDDDNGFNAGWIGLAGLAGLLGLLRRGHETTAEHRGHRAVA